jgi:hypothetical protein
VQITWSLQRKQNKNKIKLTESLKGNKVEKIIRDQLITITNYDDPMSANQHQELPVGTVNYCFQQFTVSTLVFVLTYIHFDLVIMITF